ncbi:protein YIPF1 isoform X2 [Lingula anatina]|uniref:Protein YIPF n=1 Tax=Lingula anatina TaxID=7574 RepID=A0A1S3JWS5_LINAN|nr:protein YIPF1 isoform X2 [Lingula anatina]|eukprot:XP_013414489.1 protein YIPF1 isoform X2 [Lingula anatina]
MAGKDSTLLDIDQDPADQLEFQDIPHIHGSEKGPRDEDGQTHTFTTFPAAADDSEDEVEGKPQLLTDKKQPSFWTFEYYQTLFDVDTIQVVIRILNSVVPRPKSNYLQSYIRPNPDLYGPFWICATLIFTTAITGNLANYFHTEGRDYEWKYDFHKVTFSATAIFSYWLLVPLALWGFLWWRRSSAGYSFLEILCVYGYSLAIYVPVSILWVINISWLQYLLVILSMVLSGTVLVIVFWPAVKEDDKKSVIFDPVRDFPLFLVF